jgi:hypothetical protein
MEIIERAPQKIVIREKGYSGWLRASITWLIWCIIPISLVGGMNVEKFSCQRIEPQQVNCQIDRKNWLEIGEVESTLFQNVQIITKEKHKNDEGDDYYKYFIRTRQGKFELNFLDNSRRTLINRFLEDPESHSMKIDIFTQTEALSSANLIAIFAFINFLRGLNILVRSYKSKDYIFDGSIKRFIVQIEKSHRTLIEEYPFKKIQSLYIKESSNEDENIYTLFIKLVDGRRVQVSSNLKKIEEIEEIAKSISDLLKINVTIKPKWWSSELKRRAIQKSHPIYQ